MMSIRLDTDAILEVKDVAAVVHRSTDTIYTAIHAGTLVARRMGPRKWMLTRSDVEDWINRGMPMGSPEGMAQDGTGDSL